MNKESTDWSWGRERERKETEIENVLALPGALHMLGKCSTSEPAPSEFLAMAWEGHPFSAACSLADTQLRLALLYCIWPS